MSYGTVGATPGTTSQTDEADIGFLSRGDIDGQKDISRWHKIRRDLGASYNRNLGLLLVFLAQTCGSIMNTSAKLLANDETVRFHALQIIFVRMLGTMILGSGYMWYHNVPYFPFGRKGIRHLLVLRGAAGFIGLFGLYYSLAWLDLADATVITFIVPTMTAFVCFVWMREPFTVQESLAGLLAFSGVLFIARPAWLIPKPAMSENPGDPHPRSLMLDICETRSSAPTESTQQRTSAILFAIVGSFGASIAYSTIRVIGKRAHSLISVNYFAAVATLGSAFIISIHPDLHFVVPRNPTQWILVVIIGVTGFLLQFLLTEGLQREKAGRATNLLYLQLVFALIIEKLIWGTTPPVESLIGATLIVGAAVWVSLQKNAQLVEHQKTETVDEESHLVNDSYARGQSEQRSLPL